MCKRLILFLLLVAPFFGLAQNDISGVIADAEGNPLFGAAVVIEGTTEGTTTDFDGAFSFSTSKKPPFNLTVSYLGYETSTVAYNGANTKLNISMRPKATALDVFEITDIRISERQRQEALTVERMDVIAIKETPSDNFYDGLAMLKGVDITAASLGFKVINTRGFNSTSPVRSLQLIDGVDNQSPGLNFSLGNFLGASELDVQSVDIVAGASSAFFGPGAFNGVINMTTKDPFEYPGLAVMSKVGERGLQEYAIRWNQVLYNKEGEAKFAYKLNGYFMKALDWFAENYDPVDGSEVDAENPGGYDAVNVYGDEEFDDRTGPFSKRQYPGYGIVHKQGYREVDLADYNTENIKLNGSFHYRIVDSIDVSYTMNYGTGTTIYQGDNRYSLRGIQFLQNQVEVGEKGKWFIRGYTTHEDAGESYDIVTTGVRMMESTVVSDVNGNDNWFTRYRTNWGGRDYKRQLERFEGYPDIRDFNNDTLWAAALDEWLVQYEDTLQVWHQRLRSELNEDDRAGLPVYEPGTQRFDSAFNDITGRTFTEGGALFYDRSALYHVHGEYRFNVQRYELVMGSNYRWYRPETRGTIFQDTLSYERVQTDSGTIIVDSSYRVIRNEEFGAYVGVSGKFMNKKTTLSATLRMDKNQNFDYLFSPAVSAVYSPNSNHTFRTSFSSAIRNPTLADQYLYYNVGRAILLGNLNGYDSLITVNSFVDYLGNLNPDTIDYFNVDPIRPERVRTIEVGYRGIWWDKIYLDLSAYSSWYDDFIGFVIGVDADFDFLGFPQSPQVYRLAANAEERVRTQGLSIGGNYYFADKHTINGNYSYNELISGEDDPIIPAFNTPKHKYNVGLSGRDIILPFLKMGRWGYAINYRWIQGFVFEGSPQFTGEISSYGLLNAQVNYSIPKWHLTMKVGASNLLDNRVYQVYGGPRIGRLAYISLLFDWRKEK